MTIRMFTRDKRHDLFNDFNRLPARDEYMIIPANKGLDHEENTTIDLTVRVAPELEARRLFSALCKRYHSHHNSPSTLNPWEMFFRIRRYLDVFVLILTILLFTACQQQESALKSTRQGGSPGVNVLLITIDTLRADHVSSYGYPRATAPTLDRLARAGVTVESAVCTAPYTNPSHASFFTGLYPWQNGCRSNYLPLSKSTPTLASILKKHGYHTGAFVSGSPLTAAVCGLDAGFDVYDDKMTEPVYRQTRMIIAQDKVSEAPNPAAGKPGTGVSVPYSRRTGEKTVNQAVDWLKNTSSPWFLWVHLYDVHGPYVPAPPLEKAFFGDGWDPGDDLEGVRIPDYQRRPGAGRRDYCTRYDGSIYTADRWVEKLMTHLPCAQRDTLTVIVSDHGESLGEHHYGFDHGKNLYQPCLSIPVIVYWPDHLTSCICAGFMSGIDLLPSIVKLISTDQKWAEIRDLPGQALTFMRKGFSHPDWRYAETKPVHPAENFLRLYAVTNGQVKYVYSVDPEKSESYNLLENPSETQQQVTRDDSLTRTFRRMVEKDILSYNTDTEKSITIPKDQQDALKALGYLEN
jgi:arylsulfatase A-like enzyme